MKTLLVFLVLALTPAHAGKRRPPPDFIEDVLAYATIDRGKALVLLTEAMNDEQRMGTHASLIYLHAAEQNRLAGDRDLAHKYFVKVLEATDRGPDLSAARLGLALLESSSTVSSNVLTVLQDVSEKEVLATQNADRFLLLARHALKTGNPKLGSYTRKAKSYAEEDPAVETRVQASLEALLNPAEVTDPEETGPDDQGGTMLSKAYAAFDAGNKDKARTLASQAVAAGGDDQAAAEYLLRHLDAVPVNPRRIAVLLPLTGKYEPASRQVKEALEFGFASSSASLQYYDTEADPAKAVERLEQAVFEDGVVAVVGPLLTDETVPVYEAAQAMRVPLISLSQAVDPRNEQDWIFQGMVTAQTQVDALLEHVMGREGLDSFAVFAPDSPYGHRAAEAFQAGVTDRGGVIQVVEFYDSEATDLIPFAKTLGRKDYEARAWEFQQLKAEAKDRNLDVHKVVLPPVVDFDAIFIPDNARRVPVACAALAYEEFPMGDFKPKKKDSPYIPLLGLSGWNNPGLVGQGGPYARGSFFTDSFLPPYSLDEEQRPAWRPDEQTQAFADAYRHQYNRTPTPLEAVTSDVGKLLGAAAKVSVEDRQGFREALLQAQPTETITNATRFQDNTRKPDWQLRILTINKDGIFPIKPAAAEPAPEAPAPSPPGENPQ